MAQSALLLHEDPLSFLNQEISLSRKLQLTHEFLKRRLGQIDRIAVVLYDPKSDLLSTFISSGDDGHPFDRYQARLSEVKSLREIKESRLARTVHDLSIFRESRSEHTVRIISRGFGSSYTLPIFLNGQFLGFVFFNSYQKYTFEREVIRELNGFGHLISSFVSAELATMRMMVSTIQAARKITAYHHLETGEHIDRVSHYARLIARELAPRFGFNDEYIEHIFLFSPLHDVGKVGVPEAILRKGNKLTSEDVESLKKHVVIGRQIVDAIIEEFGFGVRDELKILSNMAEFHHETLDGSGYPHGLSGDQIPIEARIIAVADIFDALTSSRSYKPAWSNDAAFDFLKQLAGIKFDKDCVQALVLNRRKVLEIQEGFQGRRGSSAKANRKFPRIRMELNGDFRIVDGGKCSELFPLRTRDIGRDGMMFYAAGAIPEGTLLQVNLYPRSNKITFTASVAWSAPCTKFNKRGFEIGLRFNPVRQASLLLLDFLLQSPLTKGGIR
jgi:HD-GYP domain-containing protein (c-di-GMP phosphodiesterase class II)